MTTPAMRAAVAALIEELTGITADQLDPATPLAELGLDSLTLTQLASRLQRRFAITIGFREFFTTTRTIDAVCARIAASGAAAEAPTPAPARDVAEQASTAIFARAATGDGAAAIVPMMVAQLELMAAQLQAVAAAEGIALPVAPATSAPVAAPAAPAVAIAAAPRPADRPAPRPAPVAATTGGAEPGALTPHQEAAVRQFAEAWNRKTAKSKAMVGAQRGVHADPRTASGWNDQWKEIVYPLVVDRSDGAYLWDLDGNRYIDLLSGFGPTFFGHNPPFIVAALQAQLAQGFELGPSSPLAGEAARLVCELTGVDRASFVCTGSEAVQAALRIARTVTGRSRVVTFAVDYHGNFDEVLLRGIDGPRGPRTVPSAPGVPQRAVDDMTVLEYGSDRALEYIRAHAHELAAVLVEPVQSRHPALQPRDFLHALRGITRESGAVLILDEVVTGFRVHPGGAQHHFGIEADLVTYGKVLGGGLPIGVVAGRRPFIDVLDGGPWAFGDESAPEQGVSFFAGTFVRHPLALAATVATLRYLRDAGPSLQADLNARAARFVAAMAAVARETQAPVSIEHFGSIMHLKATDARHPLNTFLWHFLRDEGVHLLEGFPTYLTLAHSEDDLAAVVAAFRRAIARMFAARFWTSPAAAPGIAPAAERFSTPPVPGARLGRAADGSAAWFVEDPATPGRYVQVDA